MLAERLTFEILIQRYIENFGEKQFLTVAGETSTAVQLDRRVNAAANALAELGIGAGDVIGAFSATSLTWLDVFFAAPRAGAVIAPLNLALHGPLLTYQMNLAEVKVLLTDVHHLHRVREVAADVPTLTTVLVIGEPEDGPAMSVNVMPASVLGEGDPDAVRPDIALGYDAPTMIMFTSGTTGRSKGVVLSQQYQCNVGAKVAGVTGYGPDDISFGSVPLFHMSGLGMTLSALSCGAATVIDSQFSVSGFWDRVAEVGATGFHGVGPMLMMLWNQPPGRDVDNGLRIAMVAPIPSALHLQFEQRWKFKLTPVYGLTEAVPLAYQRWDQPSLPGSVGQPSPSFEVRIVDDDDESVQAGEVGEIVCRPKAPHVCFLEYHRDAAATVAQTRNLWYHTGDVGRFDDGGHLYFIDRKKDAIRRRGENISSAEVEASLLRHPEIVECAAFPVPSDLGEDEVRVAVVRAAGSSLTEPQVIDHCAELLPYFAVPRFVDFIDEIPKNAVGRVLKFELRAQAAGRPAWDRIAARHDVAR